MEIFILPYKAVSYAFSPSFILSHWLHPYLCNYFAATYTKLEERRSGSNENGTSFLFSFHFNSLKGFKVINWKL